MTTHESEQRVGQLIVEQIVSADGHVADADGGIGFFQRARRDLVLERSTSHPAGVMVGQYRFA